MWVRLPPLAHPKKSVHQTIRKLFLFALPIIFGQVGHMLINLGEVWVAGRYDATTLAATGVANGMSGPVFVTGMGFLMGLSPVLAKRFGAGKSLDHLIATTLAYSLLVTVLISAGMGLLWWLTPNFGFQSDLVQPIRSYLGITILATPGVFLYQAIREFHQAQNKRWLANFVTVTAAVVNIGTSFLFAFGWGPIPRLGIVGLAYSVVLIRSLMGLVMLISAWPDLRQYFHLDKIAFRETLHLGAPVALAFMMEASTFGITSVLIGGISATQAAAHNIVITIVSTTFMVPFALSAALSVTIGQAYGARDWPAIKKQIQAGLLLGLGIMSILTILFLSFPNALTGWLTPDLEVHRIAASILLIAALFQLVDGAQCLLGGILRGMQTSKPTLLITIISYWLIGLPIGCYFAYWQKMDAWGLWLGIASGLAFAALGLSSLLKRTTRLIRIEIESESTILAK